MEINRSIGCTVSECKYHAKKEDFCSLKHIKVVKHEKVAEKVVETDCGSFELGKH
jgi:hypothetical protein